MNEEKWTVSENYAPFCINVQIMGVPGEEEGREQNNIKRKNGWKQHPKFDESQSASQEPNELQAENTQRPTRRHIAGKMLKQRQRGESESSRRGGIPHM